MPRPATKRNDIINTALQLFAEKGVKATTIRDIAGAAGVTEGALYRHFEGKEELAQYLFATSAELFYEHLVASVDETASAPERLRTLVCAFFDFAFSRPDIFGFVMARHFEGAGEAPATNRLPKRLFVETIAQGIAAGELRLMDPELGAGLVVGMAVQTIFFLQRGVLQQSRDQVKCEVCGAVQRVFSPAAA